MNFIDLSKEDCTDVLDRVSTLVNNLNDLNDRIKGTVGS